MAIKSQIVLIATLYWNKDHKMEITRITGSVFTSALKGLFLPLHLCLDLRELLFVQSKVNEKSEGARTSWKDAAWAVSTSVLLVSSVGW